MMLLASVGISLLVLINFATSCKFIDNIREQIVDYELQNNGFHRDYVATIKVSAMERFIDCRLAVKVPIPRGAYVDTVNLQSSLLKHCFVDNVVFDVEQPEFAASSKPQSIVFHADRTARKQFVIEDTLKFPIHLRYHAATDVAPYYANVSFATPKVFISCDNNATTIFSDANCQRYVHKVPCACSSLTKHKKAALCEYLRLNVQPSGKALTSTSVDTTTSQQVNLVSKEVVALVPLGDAQHRMLVVCATVLFNAGLVGIAVVYMAFWTSPVKV